MRVTLRVTAGPHKGREFSFAGHDTFVVGRSKRAHFRLAAKDGYFSRFHFLVEVNPPQCRLVDMGSRNGTRVNGAKVKSADLRDGDQIQAGRTVLRVVVGAAAPEVPLVVPETVVPDGADFAARGQPMASVWAPARAGASPAAEPTVAYQPAASTPCLVCAAPADAEVFAGTPLCRPCRGQLLGQPQPIPGYQLVRELGRGGMGVVSLAIHTASGTLAAVKMIRPTVAGTPADVERFLREARILCTLDHPNIVAFRRMGEAEGKLYFAMDYVRGLDAAGILKAGGPLAIGRAVRLTSQVLEALVYAHGRGFVHRDVKPRNILVTEQEGQEAAKLADFGLARTYHSSKLSGLTLTGEVGGTPSFMPPEHITDFRNASPAADQYSAAATLYTLLTDRHLFDEPMAPHELLGLILNANPPPVRARRPGVPEGLALVVHRALAKEPKGRYEDIAAMRRALMPFAAGA